MKPGATTWPSASITWSPAAASTRPSAAITPSLMPTSPRKRGIRRPSTIVPRLITRSKRLIPALPVPRARSSASHPTRRPCLRRNLGGSAQRLAREEVEHARVHEIGALEHGRVRGARDDPRAGARDRRGERERVLAPDDVVLAGADERRRADAGELEPGEARLAAPHVEARGRSDRGL